MSSNSKPYQIRLTKNSGDIALAQAFRGALFRVGSVDVDPVDDYATHALITDQYDEIVCVFRMLAVSAENLDRCYSAQYYDLAKMQQMNQRALELGRFCIHPDHNHPDIVRLAWARISKYVMENQIDILFGCSSFQDADANFHAEALALLKDRYLAPTTMMPKVKSPNVLEFAKTIYEGCANLDMAKRQMPPLLRSYLAMGGWVSDHAVVDRDLNTLHVFTGLEVNKIPPARLRAFAGLAARA